MKKLLIYIKLCRPHQWIKNLFVLTGVIFGHGFNDPHLLISALRTMIAFCFMSSAVYIYNDLQDISHDRHHPTKKNRPLASGKIKPQRALFLAVFLFFFSLSLVYSISCAIVLILFGYFLLNIAYTHYLKNMVILDVFAISCGFMLRIFAGTTGLYIPPSGWLLFCGLSLTLFLGFTKRRAEIIGLEKNELPSNKDETLPRKVLKNYGSIFLDNMISIMATCSIISYSLYTMSTETIYVHHTEKLIYTVPLVIYGIFRYLYLLHQKNKHGEDTAKDILTDKPLVITLILWTSAILYLLILH